MIILNNLYKDLSSYFLNQHLETNFKDQNREEKLKIVNKTRIESYIYLFSQQ